MKEEDKEKIEFASMLFREYEANARHHESQRSTVTNMVIVVGGVILTIVTREGVTFHDIPLLAVLVGLGFFGAFFSVSHFERYHRNKRRAKAYRDLADEILYPSEQQLKNTKDNSDEVLRKQYPRLQSRFIVRVHYLWVAFPLLFSIAGAYLLFIAKPDSNDAVNDSIGCHGTKLEEPGNFPHIGH